MRNKMHGGWLIYMLVCGLIIGFCGPSVWHDLKTPTTPAGPPVVMEVMDPTLAPYALAWQAEIGRRFPHAVGILCHGGNHLDGVWDTSAANFNHLATAQTVVRMEQARYPGRTIVLLGCNPGHLKLNIPGVYYAHSLVWLVPDRVYSPDSADGKITICLANPVLAVPPAKVVPPPVLPKILFIPIEPVKLRSELFPDVIGNIFEFTAD